MKALITGGAGFIGSHLTDYLLKKGLEVSVIDNLQGGWTKNLKQAQGHPNFSFCEVDIRDKKKIENLFEEIDWVFHLAAKS